MLTDGRAVRTRIEAGQTIGDAVQASGVKPGDRVIVKPLDRISDGERVKVASK